MAIRDILIFVTFAALVCANEIDDSDQKKRGAGKATSLNAIPTGAQKPEYTYSIYPQSSPPNPTYQQVPNSFYPAQGSNQYYTQNAPVESNPLYSQQPQLNLIPPSSSPQFLPLNFAPNAGYQTKYQLIPTKAANGNIQLMLIPQQAYPSPSGVPYQFFTPNAQQFAPQQGPVLGPVGPQGPFNLGPNYQQLQPPLGGQFLGQPSTMLLFAQPNPYNNLVYQNPVQSFYNYYPNNSQAKYNLSYGASQPQPNDYEKLQGPIVAQGDNDIAHSSDYVTQADSQSYNKNSYSPSRSGSYSKS